MAIDYQARMRHLLDMVNLDAVALVPGTSMLYFTGLHYHLSERPIVAVITRRGMGIVVPRLELSRVADRADLAAKPFVWTDELGYSGAFREMVQALGLDSVALGVDGLTMRVFEWLAFGAAGVDLNRVQDASGGLLRVRSIKTPEEIDAMRRAIAVSEAALDEVLASVQPGMTEVEIARKLREAMRARGAERDAFGPLVLTGPKTAMPHGNSDQRQLGADEFLLIDYGAVINDYPADITRTFCLGQPSDEMRAMYDAVYRANQAARKVAGPGVSCEAVDHAAREVIEAAGYGEYFTHRTGHGLGLDVHELPQIAAGVADLLEPGMVFTIEPGIYVPGIGGVRIEDNVVITEDGSESLTQFRREL